KPENQIDYLEMPSSDLTQTKQFFTSAFGWKFEDYGPAYTSFNDGRLSGGFSAGGGILPVIYASDLAAAQERIKAAGGRIVKETFSFPGGQRFHFTDPSGNEMAVWSDAGIPSH